MNPLLVARNLREEDLASFDADDPATIETLVRKLAGVGTNDHRTAGEIWTTMALPYLLMEWLRQLRSEESLVDELAARPDRVGVQRNSRNRLNKGRLSRGFTGGPTKTRCSSSMRRGPTWRSTRRKIRAARKTRRRNGPCS